MKLLVGLSTLPRTLSLDDPRLPWIELTSEPLRLNTNPVPAQLLAETPPTHEARVAAVTRWLQSQADPWSATVRTAIADYMTSLANSLACHHAEIKRRLTRYDDLYSPQDDLWSALRPLPRAWLIEAESAPIFAPLAFWDGEKIHPRPPEPYVFWRSQDLPISPFRRTYSSLIAAHYTK